MMKKSNLTNRGAPEPGQLAGQQPEKVGWIRKFCGRGIFRELWRSRYVVLRGDHLYISEKEVKDEQMAQEVFDLADYERSEELRKAKSRSKRNHSRFTLLRCRQPGNTAPNLVFLAVSPEEKESWVNALNVAIIKAKNRILDEVTIEEDSVLIHPTRDRAKIPHSRRLPTRGHLMTVVSTSSQGMLTLDLVAEEDSSSPDYDGEQEPWENSFRVELDRKGGFEGSWGVGGRQRSGTDVSKLRETSREPRVKTGSLPRGSERSWGKYQHLEVHKTQKDQQGQVQSRTPQPGKKLSAQGRSRCASMDEVLSARPALIRSELCSALRHCPTEEVQPVGQLQSLIAQRMQRAQELLEEMRLQELQRAKAERGERGSESAYLKGVDSPRLHHLRGSDSPQSSRSSGSPRSRSSDSPRLRGKDSPRLRGRESPRSKAKKNRSKGTDSPRSRGSQSPANRSSDSPHLKDSPRLNIANTPRTKSSSPARLKETASPNHKGSSDSSCLQKEVDSPVWKSSECNPCSGGTDSSQIKEAGESESPHVKSSKEWHRQSHKNSPSLSKSFDCPQVGSPGSPLIKASDLLRQRSFDSSHSLQPKPPDDHLLTPPLLASPTLNPLSLLCEEELEVERRRAEAERLLQEAVSSWKEAQEVLQEVKELQCQTLRRQRRRTYEKMSLTAATAGLPMATAAAVEDTPTSPTSPEEEDESQTP